MVQTCYCTIGYYDFFGECYCVQCGKHKKDCYNEEKDMSKQSDTYYPIFVYGTLKPGGRLAQCWQRAEMIQHVKKAIIFGTMYDINGSYPAITTKTNQGGCNLIQGFALYPKTIKELNKILEEFDVVEGVQHSLYKRIKTKTTAGEEVWTYVWADDREMISQFDMIENGFWNIRTGGGAVD